METLNYDKFSNINIDSLSFLWNYSRNKSTYNRLKANNIETLKDLFEKYDSNSIVFPSQDIDANNQARAIIELIRFKYLRSDILLEEYLVKEIHPYQVLVSNSKSFHRIMEYLRALGFERRQASSLAYRISRTLDKPRLLGDILTDIQRKNIRITGIGMNELEDYRIKLSIIVEYFTAKKNQMTIPQIKESMEEVESEDIVKDMYIKGLEEEEKQLISRRNDLDKKIEFIQGKIKELKEEKGKRL